MEHAFEDVEVKENAIVLLENALKRKRLKCMLSTGSMTDPYFPLEDEFGSVRKALSLAYKYGFGFTLITKSNRVLKDLDLLKAINDKTKCVVQMTLTTYDEDLCKKIEPNVSTTKERVEVLKKLHDAGIPTVVWLCPILPFINDTEENIRGLLEYCCRAKTYGILTFGMGVTLRDGDRQYFYEKLEQHFPGLRRKYIENYGNAYEVGSPRKKELMAFFKRLCSQSFKSACGRLFFMACFARLSRSVKPVVSSLSKSSE